MVRWYKNPYVVLAISVNLGGIITARLEWTILWIEGTPVRLWHILGILGIMLVVLSCMDYAKTRGATGPKSVLVQPDRPGGTYMDGMLWQTHDDLLWKVHVSWRSGSLKVARAKGPFCAECRTALVSKSLGGLLGTDIMSEEYWTCPNKGCRFRRKIHNDEGEQKDEVAKVVQGQIDRETVSTNSDRITWNQ